MFKCVICTLDTLLSDRVAAALHGLASVLRADPVLTSLRDTVANAKPDLVIIDTDMSGIQTDLAAIVHALLEVDPDHAMVAIGDDTVAQALLMAIRAGARDFINRDEGAEALRNSIAGHLGRAPRRARSDSGRLIGVVGSESASGASSFAINYAASRAATGHDVLLIDCNLPSSEAGAALDLDLNYAIRDALHDLSRLDRTLLTATLATHAQTGLHVLPLAINGEDIGDLTPSAIMSMLLVMRGLFGEIIFNAGGIRDAGLLGDLVQSAKDLFVVIDQKFTALKSCKELLTQLSPTTDALSRITLVVDDYDDGITLTEKQILAATGLQRSMRLPASRVALVNALNRGKPLVIAEPRHPYARAITKLAADGKKPAEAPPVPQRRLSSGFITRLVPRAS
jgi:pilus assembly protein CpaE